jgi:hypothetical protein
MVPRTLLLALALALAGGARADAATVLGSPDAGGPPDAYACAGCPPGGAIGFRQFALRGATVEAPEAGVLVSARAYAKRTAGTEPPLIAVLRPEDGAITARVVATAPLPVSSPTGAVQEVRDLHLPVQSGDALAFLFRPGEVDLGMRMRPWPDGATVSFSVPCAPCGMNPGTGAELLFAGTVEPDADADGLGDESQDPDLGGAIGDELDPFPDEGFDDEEDFDDDPRRGRHRRARLRVVRATPERDGGATVVVAAPRAGRLEGTATTGVRRHRIVASGKARARHAGRIRIRLHPRRDARRRLTRHGGVRARLTIRFRPRHGRRQTATRALTLTRRAS